jgi:hypothetical protein
MAEGDFDSLMALEAVRRGGGVPQAQAAPPAPDVPQAVVPRGDQVSGAFQATQTPPRIFVTPIEDRVLKGIEEVEGPGISPKGAERGLMPATAAELGVDPKDAASAREGRRRYFEQMMRKYGNVDDALMAFNWGPGNVDRWISQGRQPEKVPKETQEYVPNVLGRAGAAGAMVVAAKGRGTEDDLKELESKRAGVSTPTEPVQTSTLTEDVSQGQLDPLGEPTAFIAEKLPQEQMEQLAALVTGARRGAQSLITGPVQMMLPEEQSRQFTNLVNRFESQFDELTERHPAMAAAGDLLGTTVGIMGTGGLLGAMRVPAMLRNVLPAAVQASRLAKYGAGVAGGAVLGATQFLTDPEEPGAFGLSQRSLGGVLGGALGALGTGIGEAVGWGARELSDRRQFQSFMEMLKLTSSDLSKATSRFRDLFLPQYERKWEEKNALYALRNASGREFEGFHPEELSGAITAAREETREAGVAREVAAVAGKVRDELGLAQHEAAKRAYEAEQEAFRKDLEVWNREAQQVVGRFPSSQLPDDRRRIAITVWNERVRAAEDAGRIGRRPVGPEPFEPKPVEANKFSAGIQAIHKARVSAKTRPAVRRQLTQIESQLMQVAQRAAEEYGTPVGQFLRDAARANEFFRDEIGPIYNWLDKATPAEVRAGVLEGKTLKFSPAWFYDRVAKVITGKDPEMARRIVALAGPNAAKEMQRTALHLMLDKAQSEKGGMARVAKFITENRDVLQVLMGRQRVEELQGFARIAQRLNDSSRERQRNFLHRAGRWGAGSILWVIGAEQVVEGLWHGDTGRAMRGVGLMATPFAAHVMLHSFQKMTDASQLMPLVRRAARQSGADLDRTIRQIEGKWALRLPTAGRVVEQEMQPEASAVAPP